LEEVRSVNAASQSVENDNQQAASYNELLGLITNIT